MTANLSIKNWSQRVKNAAAALLFLTAYTISAIGPFVPVASAAVIPSNQFDVSSVGFVIKNNSAYSVVAGQPTAVGELKNGNVGTYPEGACIPIEFKATNNSSSVGDAIVSPVFDYNNNGKIGVVDYERVTTSLSGDPSATADNLNDFTFSGMPLSTATSFPTSSGGSVTAEIDGPYSGNDAGTTGPTSSDAFRHYNITLKNIPVGDTVYILTCGRLSLDASEYPGASLSFRTVQGGQENVAIPVNQILVLPSITINKTVVGGSAAASEFSFTLSPDVNGHVGPYSIPAGQTSVKVDNVNPDGTYQITESGPSGYSFTSGSGTRCTADATTIGTSSGVMSATVAAAKSPLNAVCNFTNSVDKGSITIVKDATPNGSQEFDFTATGVSPTDFPLTDDGTTANTKVFNELTPGRYTFSEDGETGWDLKSIVCTGHQSSTIDTTLPTATIDLAAGENVTCTFSNTQRGKLVVQKTTLPAGDTTEFSVKASTANGEVVGSVDGIVTDANDYTYPVKPGTYSVSETVPTGWSKTGDTCQNVVVAAGDTKYCEITNTKLGSITVSKNAIPDSSDDFSFTTTGTGLSDFALDDDDDATLSNSKTFTGLLPGTYTVTESEMDGWDFAGFSSCTADGISKDVAKATVTFELSAGQNLSCEFKNRMHGQIIVRKSTTPTPVDQAFAVTATSSDGGEIYGSATGYVGSNLTFSFGVQQLKYYDVAETVPDGWKQDSNSCSDVRVTGSSRLFQGIPTEYCDIVNTKLGGLTIKKVTNPSGVDNAFQFLAGGQLDGGFYLGDGFSKTFKLLPGEAATIDEITPAGWKLTNLTCNNDKVNADVMTGFISFTPSAGETAECTYTNTKLGSISGYKYEVNADETVVDPSSGWLITLYLNSDPTGDTYITNDAGYYLFPDLLPGEYSVSETLIEGWTQMYEPSAISLGAGENSTKNDFGNFKNGDIHGFKWNDLNGDGRKAQSEPKLSDWGIKLVGKTDAGDPVSMSVDTNESGNYAFKNLAPGTYEVCEEHRAGWVPTTPDCQIVVIDESGETNQISFGNQGRGAIEVIKHVDTDGDGDIDVRNTDRWSWDAGDDTYKTGTSIRFAAGDYTITEHQKENYHFTAVKCYDGDRQLRVAQDESVEVTVNPGSIIKCHFVNTRDTAHITVVKKVINDNGGKAEAKDFELYVNDTRVRSGAENRYLTDHEYTISEIIPDKLKQGYEQVGIYCWVVRDAEVLDILGVEKVGGLGSTFTLERDADVRCVVKNDDIQPKLKVYKWVDNGFTNLTGEPSDFTIMVEGTNVSKDEFPGSAKGTWVKLDAGEYSVTEGEYEDYMMKMRGDCEGEIAVGEVKKCYIKNIAIEDPQIHVEKSGPTQAHEGDTVEYSFVVTNPGNVPFPVVQVEDDIAGAGTYVSGDTNTNWYLDPGEEWLYTAEYVIPEGQVDDVYNTVKACGSYGYFEQERFVEQDESEGYKTVCDDDDHTLDVLHPSLMVEKDGPVNAQLGTTGTFTFTVTNTGDIALDLTKVEDSIAGMAVYQSGDTNTDGMLDLDEVWIYTAVHTFTELGSIKNVVTVCGLDPLEMEVCDDDDHTTIVYQPQVLADTGLDLAAPFFLSSGFLGLALATIFNRRKHALDVK